MKPYSSCEGGLRWGGGRLTTVVVSTTKQTLRQDAKHEAMKDLF